MTRKAAVNRMIHWQTAAIGRKVSPDSLVRYDGSRTLPAQSFRGRNDRIITAKLWKPLCRFNGKITSTSFFFIKFSIIFFHLSFDSKAVREKRKNLISLRFSRKRIEGFVSTRKIIIDKSLDKERTMVGGTTHACLRMKLARASCPELLNTIPIHGFR